MKIAVVGTGISGMVAAWFVPGPRGMLANP